jgi:hypothetical protein
MTPQDISELVQSLVKICSDNRVAKLRTGDVEIIMDPRAFEAAKASIDALERVMQSNEQELRLPSEPVDRDLLLWSAAK